MQVILGCQTVFSPQPLKKWIFNFFSCQNGTINSDEYFYWYMTFKECSSDHVGSKSHCAITKTNWYGSKLMDISNNKIRPILLGWIIIATILHLLIICLTCFRICNFPPWRKDNILLRPTHCRHMVVMWVHCSWSHLTGKECNVVTKRIPIVLGHFVNRTVL